MPACEPENVLDPFYRHTLRQQLSGDPQIDDAPVGPSKSLRDAPSLSPVLIDLRGLRRADAEWSRIGQCRGKVGLIARDRVGVAPLRCGCWQAHSRPQQVLGATRQTEFVNDFETPAGIN